EVIDLDKEDNKGLVSLQGKIEKDGKVLQGHLEGHLRVYELIDSVDKPVDKFWKEDIEKQIERLKSEEFL
ncbi:hypothetical protein LCGC14_1573040, partial [marine sediment metagenome]